MTFRRTVSFKASGPVDQSTLDRLRGVLGLEPSGRLTDDWDAIFGKRVVGTADGPVRIQLSRDDARPGWNIDLYLDGSPAGPAGLAVEPEIVAAIEASGLALVEVFRVPGIDARVRRMRELTRGAHDGQTRNGGRVPYWVHTDAVADICRVALVAGGERAVLGDEVADDLVLAAYGHDLYEDTAVSPAAVRAEFGARVDGWIRDLTNEAGDHDRAVYLAHLATMSEEARVIKCADLIDNTLSVAYGIHDLGLDWVRGFFLPIGTETREVLRATAFERLPATGTHLLGLVDWAWTRLAGSVDTATGQSWAKG